MNGSAYQKIRDMYGQRPHVDVFDEFCYRVVLWDWHEHHGATSGQPSAQGASLNEACERLLARMAKPSVLVVRTPHCDDRCHNEYQRSPAAALAAEEFWAFLGKQGKGSPSAWNRLTKEDE